MKLLLFFAMTTFLTAGFKGSNKISSQGTGVGEDTTKAAKKDTGLRSLKRIPVDVRGRALDTDKDGIPDYKDKELLTLQSCFPVDSAGIGLCPDPACCRDARKP